MTLHSAVFFDARIAQFTSLHLASNAAQNLKNLNWTFNLRRIENFLFLAGTPDNVSMPTPETRRTCPRHLSEV